MHQPAVRLPVLIRVHKNSLHIIDEAVFISDDDGLILADIVQQRIKYLLISYSVWLLECFKLTLAGSERAELSPLYAE